MYIEKGWCAKKRPNYSWDCHPLFKILPMWNRTMVLCWVLAFTEQIWMTRHFQSILHSIPSRLPSWWWTIIIKIILTFLDNWISNFWNWKLQNKQDPSTLNSYFALYNFIFPTSITFPTIQYSFAIHFFSLYNTDMCITWICKNPVDYENLAVW